MNEESKVEDNGEGLKKRIDEADSKGGKYQFAEDQK